MARKARQRISYVLPLADQKSGHRLGVSGLAVDSESSILYSGGRDGVVCAWDLSALDLAHASPLDHDAKPAGSPPPTAYRQQVQAHTHWINHIALADQGRALVSASSDITVKVWRPGATERQPPQPIGLHSDYVKKLAVPSQASDWVASGGLDRTIKIWDLNGAGQKLGVDVGNDEPGSLSSKEKGSVYALAATPTLVAGGGPESTVRVWDTRTGQRVTKLVGHTDNIRDVLISQDGTKIMTASSDRTVKVWSTTAGRCMFTFTMHDASVWSLFSQHPDLGVFYSSDRNGLIAKTDTRGYAELDEGISVALAQEHEGVHQVVAAGDSVWTATSRPSINRWRDVNTDGAEIDVPDNYTPHRASISTAAPKCYPSPTSESGTLARHRSTSSARRKIPLKHMLRLSNTAYFPTPLAGDASDVRTSVSVRRGSKQEAADPDAHAMQPVRQQPDHAIEGQDGLVKHTMLNDRKRVLTKDTAGEVLMWDLLRCKPIKSFGKRQLDDVEDEVRTAATVPNWCTVDTRIGSVTVILEENTCFDAEMYTDELDLDEDLEFREDQRVNLGKWVLRYLFSNLIAEEIRRDTEYRQQLLSVQEEKTLQRENAPGKITLPQNTAANGWDVDASGPPSAATLKAANGANKPSTPGLAIGMATPAPGMHKPGQRESTAEDGGALEQQRSTTSNPRASTDRNSDYFSTSRLPTADITSPAVAKGPVTPSEPAEPATQAADHSSPKDATPSKDSSLFGKKFSMRGMGFNSMKKLGRDRTADKDKPAPVEEESKESSSDNHSTKTSSSRAVDDNLAGVLQKLHHGYADHLSRHAAATTAAANGLPVDTVPGPPDLATGITPALPAECPVLHPPPSTTLLIQEDRPEAGGVADLFEGTVASLSDPSTVDAVERVAPMWLGEVLLRNTIPNPKDVVKISFVLEPVAGCGLPVVAGDGNNRLNANRMLRARKIVGYVAERVEAPAELDESGNVIEEKPGDAQLKPEDYLEIWCQGQVIPPTMTLATIRSHLWRGGGDIVLYYQPNGRKTIKPAPSPEELERAAREKAREAAEKAREAARAEQAARVEEARRARAEREAEERGEAGEAESDAQGQNGAGAGAAAETMAALTPGPTAGTAA